MIPLRTERLVIRNWEDRDRPLFHRINSDPQVMEFFPFRRDREASDRLLDRLHEGIAERGFGFCALERLEDGACMGFAGLSLVSGIPGLPADSVEIGWRLAPEFWGKGYVTEASNAWLDYGFSELGLKEIVSFAVRTNKRSTSVMERIGMTHYPDEDFDHPAVPDSHPALKPHVLYRISYETWQRLRSDHSVSPS
ncbi:GNAT family N-acetyltransferase [Nitratireductor thuwali]|uniref:Ribosomal N-acetyltransferase YdaF n=1 Tax=Nitratireductor thuwali TaxID=2267699 RepID=A0ABY5MFX2_9HYPH|nr:Putative ribosomal N-acetyltransferase YdaF [Nitratireductor thuwali]